MTLADGRGPLPSGPLGQAAQPVKSGIFLADNKKERMVCLGVIRSSSRNESQHHLYERKTQAASLLLGPEKKPQLTIEYTHSLKRETDPEQDCRADVVVARIAGSF